MSLDWQLWVQAIGGMTCFVCEVGVCSTAGAVTAGSSTGVEADDKSI